MKKFLRWIAVAAAVVLVIALVIQGAKNRAKETYDSPTYQKK